MRKSRTPKEMVWRTIKAPKGYELDVSQKYMAEFTGGATHIRLFFKRMKENE